MGVGFGSAFSAQPCQILGSRPLAPGNEECFMPPGDLAGEETEATTEEAAGDRATHKEPDYVADSALWENKFHKVILFWTIWCPRDSKPKKTWAKEREPAMLKPAGEASLSRVKDGRSCGFPSWNPALMPKQPPRPWFLGVKAKDRS